MTQVLSGCVFGIMLVLLLVLCGVRDVSGPEFVVKTGTWNLKVSGRANMQ
jgi:hypothetical protein